MMSKLLAPMRVTEGACVFTQEPRKLHNPRMCFFELRMDFLPPYLGARFYPSANSVEPARGGSPWLLRVLRFIGVNGILVSVRKWKRTWLRVNDISSFLLCKVLYTGLSAREHLRDGGQDWEIGRTRRRCACTLW